MNGYEEKGVGAQQQVVPGPCNPVTGCPPPTEIVCIKVDKVYEECRQTLTNVETVDLATVVPPPVGTVTSVECVSAQVTVGPTCTILPGGRVRVTFSYTYTIRWTDDLGPHLYTSPAIPMEITVRMARAGEPGLLPQCEVYLDCVESFLSDATVVTSCIGKLILFKLYSHVQIMVPSYGFCPQPPECQVAGQCPTWEAPWPPYPPQTLGATSE